MQNQELVVKVENIQLAAKCWGDPSKPILLALHGWLDNAASFDPIAPFFKDYHLIALDFPGHGLSEHYPNQSIYHFIDAAIIVIKLSQKLAWSSFSLLGHSMGGGVASLVAGIIPEKIKEVFIIEGLGPLTEVGGSAPKQLGSYLIRFDKIKKQKIRFYASLEEAMAMRSQKGHVMPEEAAILATRGVTHTEKGYYWHHDRRLILPSPLRLTEEQVLAFLESISAPVKLVVADKGFKIPEDQFQKRCERVPHLITKVFSGGHHVHMEQPENVAEFFLGTKKPKK